MDLTPETLDYLHGRRFSNGHDFRIDATRPGLKRSSRLMELSRGQRVLHVGCCDHLELIREKIELDLYLHQKLCRVALHCVGVDTNAEGVVMLRELGFPEVYLPDDTPEQEFDICLLADVIEHVGDPVSFLRSMRRYRFKRLIVVTPNVFRWRNSLPGAERINTDHRFWFSPYTLSKVLVDAGYEPAAVELCHGDYATWKGSMAASLTDWVPRWRDTLLVQARP